MTAPAENLTAAVAELDRAVQRFLAPRSTPDGPEPSLYAEVDRRRHEKPESTGRRATYRFSGTPICLESAEIFAELEKSIRPYRQHPDDDPATVLDRLTRTDQWRPQDSSTVLDWAEAVADWSRRALRIVDPPRVFEVRAACPACDVRIVHRHVDGSNIRVPALTVTAADGARCLNCDAHWPPAQIGLLVRVLEVDQSTSRPA